MIFIRTTSAILIRRHRGSRRSSLCAACDAKVKVPATARASFSFYTRREIDVLARTIEKVIEILANCHFVANLLRRASEQTSQLAISLGNDLVRTKRLYQEVISTITRSPGFRKLESANYSAEGYNPLCGDQLTVYLISIKTW